MKHKQRPKRFYITAAVILTLAVALTWIFIIRHNQKSEMRRLLNDVRNAGLDFCKKTNFPIFPYQLRLLTVTGQIDEKQENYWNGVVSLSRGISINENPGAPVAWVSYSGHALAITLEGNFEELSFDALRVRCQPYAEFADRARLDFELIDLETELLVAKAAGKPLDAPRDIKRRSDWIKTNERVE